MALLKSVRRRVDRKILRFALTIGAVGLVLAAVQYGAASYPTVRRWQRINQQALSTIKCTDSQCDTSELVRELGRSARLRHGLAQPILDHDPFILQRGPATLQPSGLC